MTGMLIQNGKKKFIENMLSEANVFACNRTN